MLTDKMETTVKAITILIVVAIIIGLFILGPLITIWALNTLFSLGIAYNVWTWLAALWLGMMLTTAGSANRRHT